MITNNERREAAARLRDFSEEGSPADIIYGGTECYDQMLVCVLRQIVGKGDLFERLADLIDRPTCHLIEDDEGCTACSECGCSALCMSSASYCPDCGAEVVREESA